MSYATPQTHIQEHELENLTERYQEMPEYGLVADKDLMPATAHQLEK